MREAANPKPKCRTRGHRYKAVKCRPRRASRRCCRPSLELTPPPSLPSPIDPPPPRRRLRSAPSLTRETIFQREWREIAQRRWAGAQCVRPAAPSAPGGGAARRAGSLLRLRHNIPVLHKATRAQVNHSTTSRSSNIIFPKPRSIFAFDLNPSHAESPAALSVLYLPAPRAPPADTPAWRHSGITPDHADSPALPAAP